MPSKIDVRYKQVGGRKRALTRYAVIQQRLANTNLPKNRKYHGVELRVSKDDFVSWFMRNDFEGCSVDRIDKNGHYELGNMQLISLRENIIKDRTIIKDGMCKCYICHETKPIGDFVADKRRESGISTVCKKCESARGCRRYHERKLKAEQRHRNS